MLQHIHRYKGTSTLIDGKGGGALFLLYGMPGTGKTLTVEALALLFGRPLYNISFAELSSSVTQLEERLADVLHLASTWGALVLLDEGDALVEKRRMGELTQNSMSAVLLRLLERFSGALFITSNRASAFDEAALSRVTLAVRYTPLEAQGLVSVWESSLQRVLGRELKLGEFDAGALAAHKYGSISGRAVGAVVRLALGLCDSRDVDLSQNVLIDALNTYAACTLELADEFEVATLTGLMTGQLDIEPPKFYNEPRTDMTI